MKKVSLLVITGLFVLTALLGGCTKTKQLTPPSTTDDSATISKDSTKITELSVFDEKTSYIDNVEKIMSKGSYTVKGSLKSSTMGLITESPITISVKDENNYYYSVKTVSAYQEYLVSNGTSYILNSTDKQYAVSKKK